MDQSNKPSNSDKNSNPYAGRWVAKVGDEVIGQGGTPEQAGLAAKANRFKEKTQIEYMPQKDDLEFPPLLKKIQDILPAKSKVYLVGGAVRDALSKRSGYDLDFALPGNALKAARKTANALGGAYYRLDDEHQAGRVVLTQEDGSRQTLDFAKFRSADLESDLRARDFTINAMAVNIHEPNALLDPLSGLADLLAKRIRACSPKSFRDDPIRILRAIRFAAAEKMHIEPDTRKLMHKSIKNLEKVSPERLRSELFRILNSPRPAASVRALEMLGVLPYLLPELPTLKGVNQSPPHVSDVWEHTLHTLGHLEMILAALDESYDESTANELMMGMIVLQLGRYRKQISEHLKAMHNPERPLRPLLFFAALFHDAAKPECQSEDENGRIRFINHENIGTKIVDARANKLILSNQEIERVKTIVRNHMRPLHLANGDKPPSRRAIYRFFHATGEAGVDICLISLADLMATYEQTLPQETLEKHLGVVRTLLEAWWEKPEESVYPPTLLDGKQLMKEFKLKSGPQIGELLEAVAEAQAAGVVGSLGDAHKLVEELLSAEEE